MEFKLKIYPSYFNDIGFPSECMSVWISESDREELLGSINGAEGPIYVKIENNGFLGKFCFYAKLDVIHPSLELGKGYIWIPKELIHKSYLVDAEMKLNVSLADESQFMEAEVITIHLPEKEVESWSEDEANAAILDLKAHILLTFNRQMVFVRPKTKKTVMGEVFSIYPKPGKQDQIYIVGDKTKIVFDGLSLNKQKVVDFSKIGGLDNTINRLREIIQIPLNNPSYLKRFGINPPRGLLLYGPPGNGKTMIARAIAYAMGSHFISIEGPELTTSLVGQGEEKLREKFEEAQKKENCVIFIDEIDSVAPIRNEKSARHEITTVATLLNLMDGMGTANGILVIGATNRIETIDPALRRPGRFDLEFEIPMPSQNARYDILKKIIFNSADAVCDESVTPNLLHILAELTTGYSGADIKFLYREACMNAIRSHVTFNNSNGKIEITIPANEILLNENHFMTALKAITPSSLRGSDTIAKVCQWDDIMGLDEQRNKLNCIYKRFIKLCSNEDLISRPGCGSVIISGKKGSGKRTLITSFAQKENLEIISLDCLNLDSLEEQNACEEIENIIKKCRQLNNVLLALKNIEHSNRKNLYSNKIINEINTLNRYARIFVVLLCEDENLSNSLIGYKKFGEHINIDIPREKLIELYSKLKSSTIEREEFNTIGEMLSLINQKRILAGCE